MFFVASVSVALGDDSLCLGRPSGSLVFNPKDCQAFFQCRDGIANPMMCPQTAAEMWFDPVLIGCVPPGPFCSPSECYNKSKVFVSNSQSGVCGSWHYCLDGEISHSGQCPSDLSFIPETQFCTYPYCSPVIVTTTPAFNF